MGVSGCMGISCFRARYRWYTPLTLIHELILNNEYPVSGSLNYLLAFSAIGKLRLPIFLRLLGNYVPTVDVFVTCCGEALDVVMDTVRAASVIDYPKDRYRIFVLDDGDSTELKDQILGLPYENVYYTTRRIEVVTHSKAANLNHGLEYAAALPGGPSEMVAVLDVDMIPLPHWLRALVPHILQDEDIAMANPPQHLYNIPDGDPLGQTMDILFQIIMPLQNALNSTWVRIWEYFLPNWNSNLNCMTHCGTGGELSTCYLPPNFVL